MASRAFALGGENLSGIFTGDGRIAVVEISHGRRLYFEGSDQTRSCGYGYDAVVVENLRSRSTEQTFGFVDAGAANLLPPGRYLIFVDKPAQAAGKEPNGRPQEAEDESESILRCWVQLDYYTLPTLKTIFPLRRDCGEDAAKESVRATSEPSILSVMGFAPGPSNKPHDVCLSWIRGIVATIESD
jgi:hypothetical protein